MVTQHYQEPIRNVLSFHNCCLRTSQSLPPSRYLLLVDQAGRLLFLSEDVIRISCCVLFVVVDLPRYTVSPAMEGGSPVTRSSNLVQIVIIDYLSYSSRGIVLHQCGIELLDLCDEAVLAQTSRHTLDVGPVPELRLIMPQQHVGGCHDVMHTGGRSVVGVDLTDGAWLHR